MNKRFHIIHLHKAALFFLILMFFASVPFLASANELSIDVFVKMGSNYSASDLEGSWWLHILGTPRNGQPDAFYWTYCDISANSSGTLNGTCYSSDGYSVPTGNFPITVDSSGNVTLPKATIEQDFTVLNASTDVMIGINNAASGADQYMSIWSRQCTDCQTADLAGTWKSHALLTRKNGGPDDFGYEMCEMTIDTWGYIINGTCEDQDGNVDDKSGGAMTVASDGRVSHPSEPGETYNAYMSSRKDLVVEILNGSTSQGLNVLAKMDSSGNYSTSDLAGSWQKRSIGTQMNGYPDSYLAEKCSTTIQSDGSFNSSCEDFEGSVHIDSGSITLAANGTVNLPSDPYNENHAVLNIGKDIVISNDKYEAPQTAHVLVADAIGLADDLQMPFGNLTAFLSLARAVRLTNDGDVPLDVGNINQVGSLAEFVLENDYCSGQPLLVENSCTFLVRFAPSAENGYSDSVEIPLTDPDLNPITKTVIVNGSGLSSANSPPSQLRLIYPYDGQTGIEGDVEFKWERSTDQDMDTIIYHLYCGTDPDFIGCPIKAVVFNRHDGIYYAGSAAGMIIFGLFVAGVSRSRRIAILLLATTVVAGMLLITCGGGNSNDNGEESSDTIPAPLTSSQNNEVTKLESGLSPGTTYYWKVVADDGNGGITESEVRTFSTQ